MRIQGLTTETSLTKTTPHKLYVPESGENAVVLVQEDKHVKCQRLALQKVYGFEQGKVKVPGGLLLKDRTQINTDKGSKRAVLLLDSASLSNMDKETKQAVKTATYVMTDSDFSIQAYVAQIESLIEQDKDNGQFARSSFLVVSTEAFSALRASVLSSKAKLTSR